MHITRLAAAIVLAAAIIGIHATPVDAAVAVRVNRYIRAVGLTASGDVNCPRDVNSSRYVVSVTRNSQRRVQTHSWTCTKGSRRVKFIHYLNVKWDANGFASAWHELEMAYNEAPGILFICSVGLLQAPLWGTVTDTFPESRDGDRPTWADFNPGCGYNFWNVHVEAIHSWSATTS